MKPRRSGLMCDSQKLKFVFNSIKNPLNIMARKFIVLGLALLSLSQVVNAQSANNENGSRQPRSDYGDNMLRFSPVTALDIAAGPGISYEHIFGADKSISVVLPVSLLLDNEDDYYGYDDTHYATYVYFTPG